MHIARESKKEKDWGEAVPTTNLCGQGPTSKKVKITLALYPRGKETIGRRNQVIHGHPLAENQMLQLL